MSVCERDRETGRMREECVRETEIEVCVREECV